MYFDLHGVYPTVDKELPDFITGLGYKCKSTTAYFHGEIAGKHVPVENKGLEIAEEDAIPFILRFG